MRRLYESNPARRTTKVGARTRSLERRAAGSTRPAAMVICDEWNAFDVLGEASPEFLPAEAPGGHAYNAFRPAWLSGGMVFEGEEIDPSVYAATEWFPEEVGFDFSGAGFDVYFFFDGYLYLWLSGLHPGTEPSWGDHDPETLILDTDDFLLLFIPQEEWASGHHLTVPVAGLYEITLRLEYAAYDFAVEFDDGSFSAYVLPESLVEPADIPFWEPDDYGEGDTQFEKFLGFGPDAFEFQEQEMPNDVPLTKLAAGALVLDAGENLRIRTSEHDGWHFGLKMTASLAS